MFQTLRGGAAEAAGDLAAGRAEVFLRDQQPLLDDGLDEGREIDPDTGCSDHLPGGPVDRLLVAGVQPCGGPACARRRLARHPPPLLPCGRPG